MFKRSILLLAALPVAALAGESVVTHVEGDVIVVEEAGEPASSAPEAERRLPVRGMDMANVRNIFGTAREEHPAVGDPPITRWDYDGYSVFFEHDKVLHSVVTE